MANKQNLNWAFGYNVVLIPVAAGVMVPLICMLSPMLAGAATHFVNLLGEKRCVYAAQYRQQTPPVEDPIRNHVYHSQPQCHQRAKKHRNDDGNLHVCGYSKCTSITAPSNAWRASMIPIEVWL